MMLLAATAIGMFQLFKLSVAIDEHGFPDISHECGGDEVLHLETNEFLRINMQCNMPRLCEKPVSCSYSQKAICLGTNEFVAGVSEVDGVVLTICCELGPVPQELFTYSCGTFTVADGEPAHMETYDPRNHPPPQQNQLVKAIVKQGESISIVVCTPVCKSTTTTTTTATTTTVTVSKKPEPKKPAPRKEPEEKKEPEPKKLPGFEDKQPEEKPLPEKPIEKAEPELQKPEPFKPEPIKPELQKSEAELAKAEPPVGSEGAAGSAGAAGELPGFPKPKPETEVPKPKEVKPPEQPKKAAPPPKPETARPVSAEKETEIIRPEEPEASSEHENEEPQPQPKVDETKGEELEAPEAQPAGAGAEEKSTEPASGSAETKVQPKVQEPAAKPDAGGAEVKPEDHEASAEKAPEQPKSSEAEAKKPESSTEQQPESEKKISGEEKSAEPKESSTEKESEVKHSSEKETPEHPNPDKPDSAQDDFGAEPAGAVGAAGAVGKAAEKPSSDGPPRRISVEKEEPIERPGSSEKPEKPSSKPQSAEKPEEKQASVEKAKEKGESAEKPREKSSKLESPNVALDKDVGLGEAAGGGGGAGACFSGDTLVQTDKGSKRMDELVVGDRVLSAISSGDGHTTTFTPIRWFIHRLPEKVAEFVSIQTSQRSSLVLTPDHLLPMVPCTDDISESIVQILANSKPASQAKAGDCILVTNGNGIAKSEISAVSMETKKGIYAPVTGLGNIVVNDVVASCYASSFESHSIQHAIFSLIGSVSDVINHVIDFAANQWSGIALIDSVSGDVPLVLQFFLRASEILY